MRMSAARRGAVARGGTRSLQSLALRGSALSVVTYGLGRVLQLGSNLILTRLLLPEAFGLMALVNVFVIGLSMVSDLGIAPSIIQSPRGEDKAFLDTAWTASIVRGFALWLIACMVAVPAAHFYEQPDLVYMIPVAAFATVISGFEATASARFQRQLRLGPLVVMEFGSQILGISVMVTLAAIYRTVWALLAGALVSAVVRTALSHWLSDRRDRIGWDPTAARDLLHFGKWILASTLLAFLSTHLDRLIFGKTIPVSMLGVYNIAAMFAAMPGELATRLGASIVFPAFSRKLQSAELGSSYNRTKLPLLMLVGLALAPLVAAGSSLVDTLYDHRYHDAGWLLQLLACGTWFRALEVSPSSVLLAAGEPRWIAVGHAAKVTAIATFVPLGLWVAGFPGAVIGLSCTQLVLYLVATLRARRHGISGTRDDLLMTSILALSAAVGLFVATRIAAVGAASVVQLVAASACSMVAWSVGAYLLLLREGLSFRLLFRGTFSPAE
jgi:O-antigen/teichoic acid export membrane protein